MEYVSIYGLGDDLASKWCCELSYCYNLKTFYNVPTFLYIFIDQTFYFKNKPRCKKSPWHHHELKEILRYLNISKSLSMILSFKINY